MSLLLPLSRTAAIGHHYQTDQLERISFERQCEGVTHKDYLGSMEVL